MKKLCRVVGFGLLLLLVACEQAFDESLEKERPQLLAPADNLVSLDSIHTFYWEPVTGATTYQLQVVSPRFDSIARLAFDTMVARNQVPLLLRKGAYQWRVRARNPSTTSKYSDTFRLTIQ